MSLTDNSPNHGIGRRQFLHRAGGVLAAASLSPMAFAQSGQQSQNYVSLPPIQNVQTEGEEKAPGPFDGPDQRIGFASAGYPSIKFFLPSAAPGSASPWLLSAAVPIRLKKSPPNTRLSHRPGHL
jgi:hypothetical protein